MVDKIEENLELDMEAQNELPIENVEGSESSGEEMTMDDFAGKTWLRNPEVGKAITFIIEKVIKNPKTTATNKTTKIDFVIGLKDKNNKVTRYDVYTDQGIYTINSWEVYFKLFDGRKETQGLLYKYAEGHNKSFKGANISIKRILDGSHAMTKIPDLKKIIGVEKDEEAIKYQEEIKLAIKERRLYEVTLIEEKKENVN